MSFKPKTYAEALAKKRALKGKKRPLSKRKKPKLRSISLLKKDLWKLVSDYIRKRDFYVCRTCGRTGKGSQIHAGHFIPNASGGALLRYHPQNIYAQCYHCNINLGGNGAEYYRILTSQYGKERVERLFELKNYSIQADRYFYTTMIDLYKAQDEKETVKFLEGFT